MTLFLGRLGSTIPFLLLLSAVASTEPSLHNGYFKSFTRFDSASTLINKMTKFIKLLVELVEGNDNMIFYKESLFCDHGMRY